jgi:hypothetical protein
VAARAAAANFGLIHAKIHAACVGFSFGRDRRGSPKFLLITSPISLYSPSFIFQELRK